MEKIKTWESYCQHFKITLNIFTLKVKVKESCLTLCDSMDCPWNSPGQNTGVGSCCLHQRIFPTQGLNPGLLCCRQILYQLSHQGSPRILEWAAYPFSSGSSQPRNRTRVSCIAGGFFTSWAAIFTLWAITTTIHLQNFSSSQTETLYPLNWNIPWGREWQATLVFLPGKFHR